MVWGTIAAGVGNSSVQLTIDGGSPNITSQVSNGSAIFNVVYFETSLLTDTYHTAVVTNLGSSIANGSSEFELDRFSFETSDVTPLFVPPTTSQTSSQTSSQTQSVPSATPSATFAKSSSKSPLGAISGAVIGALVLIICLLLFCLWRRRKPSSDGATGGTFKKHILLLYSQIEFTLGLTTPRLLTPFPLHPRSQSDSTAISSILTTSPQKSQSSRTTGTGIGEEVSSLATNSLTSPSQLPPLIIDNPRVPYGQNITPTSFQSSSLQRDGASIRYPYAADHALINGSSVIHSTLSSSLNMYDNPPPSYWRNENDGHRSSGSGTVTPIRKPS
jgi:hypothetical protein